MTKSNIYLIQSETRQALAQTFMRFQEYYESPEFAGKYFTVDEFMAWYAKKHRKSSYYQDWSGFNIPSTVLKPFFDGNFDPLTDKEKKLLSFFRGIEREFYIIGITKSDYDWRETLKHELAHGMFFSNKAYRKDVLSCVSDLNPDPVAISLKKMGYGSNVIDDEINAYLLTEPETMANPKAFSFSSGQKIQQKLDRVFQKHFAFSMVGADDSAIMKNLSSIAL